MILDLPTLLAERVVLRAPAPRDLPDLLRVFGDAEALRFWGHGPLADLPAARAYLAEIEAGAASGDLLQWAIDLDGRLVGTVTLADWDRTHARAELGVIVHPDHQRDGIAREAVEAALRHAFETMELHRVEADVHPDNEAALALLDRLGFEREGVARDRWRDGDGWADGVRLGRIAG